MRKKSVRDDWNAAAAAADVNGAWKGNGAAANATAEEKPVRVDRELPVPMSAERVENAGAELASLVCERSTIETELAAYGAEKRKRLREIKKQEKVLAAAIRDGQEIALVQCEEERVFAQNAIVVRRLDTHEVVETRAMRGEERQLALIDDAPEDEPQAEAEPF